MIKYINGDLLQLTLEGKFNVLIHGCNCFNTMGAGIAGQLSRHPVFHNAEIADSKTIRGDWRKLGSYSSSLISTDKGVVTIYNAYTQYDMGSDGRYVEYSAVTNSLNAIRNQISPYVNEIKIGLPKIGCGLGGGDWNIIESIIDYTLPHFDITVVNFK
jgi:O-acetyl-ADP-ribose deacetylase (regulator of RNase III)